MMIQQDRSEQRLQLRRMRQVSLVEGATLVVLIFIAVPLKHLGGYPVATATMGPIHGIAFVVYLWMLIQTVVSGEWSRAKSSGWQLPRLFHSVRSSTSAS
jgi:integral membrane protein